MIYNFQTFQPPLSYNVWSLWIHSLLCMNKICQLLRLFIDNTVVFAAIGREVYACQLTSLCSEGYVCDPQCDWVTHWAIAEDINVNQTVWLIHFHHAHLKGHKHCALNGRALTAAVCKEHKIIFVGFGLPIQVMQLLATAARDSGLRCCALYKDWHYTTAKVCWL